MVFIASQTCSVSIQRGFKRCIDIRDENTLEINGTSYTKLDIEGGEGKNGKVSILENCQNKQKVVLKYFNDAKEARNEIQMLDRLSTAKNVSRLVDCSPILEYRNDRKRQRSDYGTVDVAEVTQEKPFVLLEYAENGDLLDFIKLVYYKMRQTFSEDTIKNFTIQMLAALSSIHKLGIAHKDVKCENFLVFDHYRSLCLSDFGDAIDTTDRITVFPTEGYIAPSILYHDTTVIPASIDVWAIAVIVLIMYTGKFPFDCNSKPSGNIELIRNGNIDMFWNRLESSSPRVRQMSVEMRSFLTSILVNNDCDRPTAEQLLESNWLKC